ncbi:gamma-glutamyltransferase family protein [Pigmentiphaga kullae]|uniref:Gamma-glutamyltranspeptidase/glutathione hydrolase n=1 Tax=Pigmentiphaga kullae TaxID=151784 RepID=A0A4Q7N9X3_9BURK|nr:gamma-glutamyltransferase [Pigmentiphaga kullae]RZS78920.1 gamma-glutamyltranspeptidase/glutathione hydrolase [Pigmentiphaga kullae]
MQLPEPVPSVSPSRPLSAAGRGVVASAHGAASAAGRAMLERGGNAMDAAIAMAAALGVAQPMMSGLGGDSFILWHDAATGRTMSINGAGPVPSTVPAGTPPTLPMRGLGSASVPGAVDAMCLAYDRYASGRLSFGELLAPAIELAEQGCETPHFCARFFALNEALLAADPGARQALLIDGRVPREGEPLRQPDLARTLERLAARGRDDFYGAGWGARLVELSRQTGGPFRDADFDGVFAEVSPPIQMPYGDGSIVSNPPVAQGVVLLEALGILDRLDMPANDEALRTHCMIEALKHAFADRNDFLGDPRYTENPLPQLLAAPRLDRLAAAIDRSRAAAAPPRARWSLGSGDTTCLVAADAQGNVVSYITSISTPFGAGVVVPGTGVLLNNRAGRGFSSSPDSPNRYAPGKRTMSTLHVYMALDRHGRPVMAGGTAGGDGQPQWNLQILDAVLNRGLSLRQAVDRPRWELFPGTDPAHLAHPYEIRVDRRIDAALLDRLRALGHTISDKSLGMLGAAQVLGIAPSGGFVAAADPRADGAAYAVG